MKPTTSSSTVSLDKCDKLSDIDEGSVGNTSRSKEMSYQTSRVNMSQYNSKQASSPKMGMKVYQCSPFRGIGEKCDRIQNSME